MHYVYKFICDSKEDFLYKCKFANVRKGEITEYRLNEWFSDSNRPEDNLVGADCVWTVDSVGRLACFGELYASKYLQYVPDITNLQITLGEL